MGYLFTAFYLLVSAVAIITIYELAPQALRNQIVEFIDHLGGEA